MEWISAEAEGFVQRLRDGMARRRAVLPAHELPGRRQPRPGRRTGPISTAQLATGPGRGLPRLRHGEFFSLDEDEYRAVVTVTVEVADGRLPVVAGIGYGWAQALRFARIAEEAGADALLVLPHYLVERPAGRAGRAAAPDRRRHPAAAHRLPARPGRFQPPTACAGSREIPTVIGLKDGHSDLDRLQRLTLAAPDGFLFFNGAATAEIQARAYATVGVPAYSSAVHAFAPEIANAFFTALRDGDDAHREQAAARLLRAPGRAARPGARLRRLPGQGRGPAARPPGRPGTRPAHRPGPGPTSPISRRSWTPA